MSTVVVLADYYFPSKFAGGPLKSISSTVRLLKENHDVTIVTRNRDLGANQPYDFIPTCSLKTELLSGGIRIVYCTNYLALILSLLQLRPNFIWANSLFSRYTAGGLLYSFVFNSRMILSPRGELEPSAISGSLGKRIYIKLVRCFSLNFFVNSAREEILLREHFGAKCKAMVAPQIVDECGNNHCSKKYDFVFAGRLVPVKNLDFILDIVESTEKPVSIDIYGKFESKEYEKYVLARISHLKHINYKGVFEPKDAIKVLSQYKFLLMPSKGENFGHIIYEALCARTFVYVSDNTFWNAENLKNGGKCIPLNMGLWLEEMLANKYEFSGNPAADYYLKSLTQNKYILDGLFKK